MKLLTHYVQQQKQQQKRRHDLVNWRENHLNDALLYSYRNTLYDKETYPARLHYHDYYELVLFLEGDVEYVCESEIYRPTRGDLILIPPRALHMSRMVCDRTRYERHVFYFYPEAFALLGCPALGDFLHGPEGILRAPQDAAGGKELIGLAQRLEVTLTKSNSPLEQAMVLGILLQLFYHVNLAQHQKRATDHRLPSTVLEIQQYVDENFANLESVTQIAEHFFYSREYVSRLFQKHCHTTVADYIRQRRIARSQELIALGYPLCDVCYRVGFGNMSSFIRAFHAVLHTTPSQYRKMLHS